LSYGKVRDNTSPGIMISSKLPFSLGILLLILTTTASLQTHAQQSGIVAGSAAVTSFSGPNSLMIDQTQCFIDVSLDELGLVGLLQDRPVIRPNNYSMTDINEDGYCDLFVSFINTLELIRDGVDSRVPFRLYFFDPIGGTFVDESDRLKNNIGGKHTRPAVVADLNGDGIKDMVLNSVLEMDGQLEPNTYLHALISTADTTWIQKDLLVSRHWGEAGEGEIRGKNRGFAVGDVDVDGDLDIIVSQGVATDVLVGPETDDRRLPQMTTLVNDGLANFEVQPTLAYQAFENIGLDTPWDNTYVMLFDLNGDRILDVVSSHFSDVENRHIIYAIYGDGSGLYKPSAYQELTPYEADGVACEGCFTPTDGRAYDYDQDGDEDLILILDTRAYSPQGCQCGQWFQIQIFRNDGIDSSGKTIWSDVTQELTEHVSTQSMYDVASQNTTFAKDDIMLVDLNGDGYLDIAPRSPEISIPSYINEEIPDQAEYEKWALLTGPSVNDFTFVRSPVTIRTRSLSFELKADTNSVFAELSWSQDEGAIGGWNDWGSEWRAVKVDRWVVYSSAEPFGDPGVGGVESTETEATSITFRANSGKYYVRVAPVDEYGIKMPISNQILVDLSTNFAPLPSFESTSLTGQAPFEITFNASESSDPNGDALTFAWDFGDGATGSGETISHTYTAAGEYTVVLTASDGALTGTDSLTVSIASGVDTESFELPESFVLKAAYPNPFNPTTTITYGLPAAKEVRITATDLLGRHVATLVAGDMKAAGYYTVQFNAEGLASGTYLIRMEAGDFVATQQVVLLK